MNEEQLRHIIRENFKRILNEIYEETLESYLSNMPYEIYMNISSGKKINFKTIPKNQYKNALMDFVRYGEFNRFPVKYIMNWKDLVLENITKLSTLNAINGHAPGFPEAEFLDVFDYNKETGEDENGEYTEWLKSKGKEPSLQEKNDWNNHLEFLEERYDLDNILPRYSNNHHIISDYGLPQLEKLAYELDNQKDPNEIIVTINKILDVTHPRSDLAELFIEGGSDSLEDITYRPGEKHGQQIS